MRVVRLLLGPFLVTIATALILVAVGMWSVGQHRGPQGAFTASVQRLTTDGHAIVVSDIDALLREQAPFARGSQTTLRLSGNGRTPMFIGLAPRTTVERYLNEVPRAELTRVRLARGPLPADLTAVPGPEGLTEAPGQRPFWYARSHFVPGVGDELTWSPGEVRNRPLALVVMNADASANVDVVLTLALSPHWIDPTVGGLFVLGTVSLGLGVLAGLPARMAVRVRRTTTTDDDDDDGPASPGETDPEDTVEMSSEPLISAGVRTASRPDTADLVDSR